MLGKELRKARRKAGLTQEEAAHQAGIDRSYLSQLENDRYNPTVDLLLRLCRVIDVSAAEIVGRLESAKRRER